MGHEFAVVQERSGGVPGDLTTSVRGICTKLQHLQLASDPTPAGAGLLMSTFGKSPELRRRWGLASRTRLYEGKVGRDKL
jgi:hypothetical protein